MIETEQEGEGPQGLRIRALLRDRGVAWPSPIQHFDVLGSTSDRLKRMAQDGAPAWTVVLAERQTAGRGRQGNVWVSPVGNLYISVLLRPHLDAGAVGLVPLAAGVAVAQAIGEWGGEARLKWPNDVLIRQGKVAGILTEATSEWLVLGLGVNGASVEGLPDGVAATSLAAEGILVDRTALAAAVLARLRVCYHALDHPQEVLEQWRALSVPWWGRLVEVTSGTVRIRGFARGVDDRGALLLELADGTTTTILSGEARELRLRS